MSLIRLGIGHNVTDALIVSNWSALQALAKRQGLAAVLLDGIDRLSETERPSKSLLLQWIGDTLQSYEYRYELYRRAIAEMAGFFNEHSLKMMILKGYACG